MNQVVYSKPQKDERNKWEKRESLRNLEEARIRNWNLYEKFCFHNDYHYPFFNLSLSVNLDIPIPLDISTLFYPNYEQTKELINFLKSEYFKHQIETILIENNYSDDIFNDLDDITEYIKFIIQFYNNEV